ncbi:hypothetical protein P879_05982 [Paragonimus westermani]|uniref:Calcium permeable stress-gated cation channel n=1 Tax=Paragonimus westermani TaxID=34504 RepID=A0A8T0DFB5_9TREM|nr:hypothetical protein P879_05982 [Paragonimus westermani]
MNSLYTFTQTKPTDEPICNRINPYNNNTAVIPGYEGIPQNLLINFISWVLLLILFAVFRKLAWDYGRMALTKPRKNKWASLFYSEVRRSTVDSESHESVDMNFVQTDHSFIYWIRMYFTLTNTDIQKKSGIDAVHYLRFQLYLIVYTAVTMCFCLAVVLPLNIKGVLKSPDLQSIGVTTIANLPGESPMLWAHVLFGCLFFLLAFCLMQHFSRRLWKELARTKIFSDRTLMISGISRSNCQRDLLLRHFREAYPRCEIEDIQVCSDIRRLVTLDNQWEAVKAALTYSQKRLETRGRRPVMIPRCCGWSFTMCYRKGHCRKCFAVPEESTSSAQLNPNDETIIRTQNTDGCCVSCLCPTPVDAIDYYTNEANQLRRCIDEEGPRAMRTKIGIAFVTFSTSESAVKVYNAYHTKCSCPCDIPKSSVSACLRSRSWTVSFAPTPNNIIWSNLAISRTMWWFRAAVVNVSVFVLVFFLTTLTYVPNLVSQLQLTEWLQIQSPIVIQFIPSVFLWSISALLPWLVYNSDRLVGHWTRSGLHVTVMAKTFSLLILTVLALPSLGMTSIPALIQWLFPDMRWVPIGPPELDANTTNIPALSTSDAPFGTVQADASSTIPPVTSPWIPIGPQSFQWECVFMPDNGAFFINYVITSAFLGTALQLVRLPELINYSCRLMCVRSQAEKASVRKASQWEFDFGLYYAWTLCVFAVISAYSIICPLITPFGLIYLVFRFLVDRYNLYFAYLPSRIDSRIHWLAINFMLFAILLLQLNLFMFVAIRLGLGSPLSIAALVMLVLCTLLWLTTIVTGWIFVGSNSTRPQAIITLADSLLTDSGERGQSGSRWTALTARLNEAEGGDNEVTATGEPCHATEQFDGHASQPPDSTTREAARSADIIQVNVRRAISLNTDRSHHEAPGTQLHFDWLRASLDEDLHLTESRSHFIAPVLLSLAERTESSSE